MGLLYGIIQIQEAVQPLLLYFQYTHPAGGISNVQKCITGDVCDRLISM